MEYRKLAVQLPRERANRFEAVMRARGEGTAASALRSLIDAAMAEEGKPVPVMTGPRTKPPGPHTRLWAHVTAAEAKEARALAAPYGGVTAWFRGIVQARLGRVTELPAREEIEALHEARVELGRLGTNINQIARVLNTARLAGDPIDVTAVRLEELAALKAGVGEVARRIDGVVLAARQRVFNE